MVTQYEQYLNGRKVAHQEYSRMQNIQEAMVFLQEAPALPDLCNILQVRNRRNQETLPLIG